MEEEDKHSGEAIQDGEDAVQSQVLLVLGQHPRQHVGDHEEQNDQVAPLRDLRTHSLLVAGPCRGGEFGIVPPRPPQIGPPSPHRLNKLRPVLSDCKNARIEEILCQSLGEERKNWNV